jgi:hypothetical protein
MRMNFSSGARIGVDVMVGRHDDRPAVGPLTRRSAAPWHDNLEVAAGPDRKHLCRVTRIVGARQQMVGVVEADEALRMFGGGINGRPAAVRLGAAHAR